MLLDCCRLVGLMLGLRIASWPVISERDIAIHILHRCAVTVLQLASVASEPGPKSTSRHTRRSPTGSAALQSMQAAPLHDPSMKQKCCCMQVFGLPSRRTDKVPPQQPSVAARDDYGNAATMDQVMKPRRQNQVADGLLAQRTPREIRWGDALACVASFCRALSAGTVTASVLL